MKHPQRLICVLWQPRLITNHCLMSMAVLRKLSSFSWKDPTNNRLDLSDCLRYDRKAGSGCRFRCRWTIRLHEYGGRSPWSGMNNMRKYITFHCFPCAIMPYILIVSSWFFLSLSHSDISMVRQLPEKSKSDTVQIRSECWWWCIHQLYTMENDWNGQFFCHAWSNCIRMSSRKHPVAHIFELAWRRGSESVPSEHSEVPQGHTDYQRMEVFRHSAICRSLVVLQNQTMERQHSIRRRTILCPVAIGSMTGKICSVISVPSYLDYTG